MFERRSVDFKTISVPFTCAPSNVLCVAIVTSRSWMGLWRHCWRWQWLGRVHCTGWEWDLCLECPLQFTSYFVLFSSLFNIPCYKKGLRMVDRALWRSEALRVVPWLRPCTRLAYGSCRSPTKAQPCVPLISTMHGQPFLIPLIQYPSYFTHVCLNSVSLVGKA